MPIVNRISNLAGAGMIAFLLAAVITHRVHAEYVLPYPSYMPGNAMYRISRFADTLKEPLYWGNIASFKYRLGLADKYLVEAKTLFEYRQYLLAVGAMERSNRQFERLPAHIRAAEKEGKDMRGFRKILAEAAAEHVRVLRGVASTVPGEFTWTPEKSETTELKLGELLSRSAAVRETAKENK